MFQMRGLHLANAPTSIERAFVKGFSGNKNYPLVILPLQDIPILLLQIITLKSKKCYSIKAQELRKSWKSPLLSAGNEMPFSSFSFCSCKPDCVAGHAVKPITLQNTLTLFTPKIGVVMNSRMMMTQSNQSWIIEYRAYAPPSSHHILLKELLPKWCSHIPLCFASYTTPIKKRAPMMYSTP